MTALRARFEVHVSEVEKLADEALKLSGPFPDKVHAAAHKRYLLTLSVPLLKARLEILQREAEQVSAYERLGELKRNESPIYT